jgi:copper ion binding protein
MLIPGKNCSLFPEIRYDTSKNSGGGVMAKATIKVKGMTCNHCVMRVAKALKAVPGVQDAQVDLQKAEAVVTYDESKVAQDKLSSAVVEAGYKTA